MKQIEELVAKWSKQGITSVELDAYLGEIKEVKTTSGGTSAITEDEKSFLKNWVKLVWDMVYDDAQVQGEEREIDEASILIDCTTNRILASYDCSCFPDAYSESGEMELKLDEI